MGKQLLRLRCQQIANRINSLSHELLAKVLDSHFENTEDRIENIEIMS